VVAGGFRRAVDLKVIALRVAQYKHVFDPAVVQNLVVGMRIVPAHGAGDPTERRPPCLAPDRVECELALLRPEAHEG